MFTRADTLLDEGRWTEAEALFYAAASGAPRDPIARAALGRYLSMKGALRAGAVLIDEARRFGLDAGVAATMLAPYRSIAEFRRAAAGVTGEIVLVARAGRRRDVLFQVALPRPGPDGELAEDPFEKGAVDETTWYDVVDRPIGLDSVAAPGHRIGVEVFEALVPALDLDAGRLTLSGNRRAALTARGRRYRVLRDEWGARVLIDDGVVVTLSDALRGLDPAWWQLDLARGMLVVRGR